MFCSSNADWCGLFQGIYSSGGSVSLIGDQLRIDGASLLTTEIIEQIRAHKSTLIGVLSRSVGLVCPKCSSAQVAVPTFDGFENLECFQCGKCSGCRRIQG